VLNPEIAGDFQFAHKGEESLKQMAMTVGQDWLLQSMI